MDQVVAQRARRRHGHCVPARSRFAGRSAWRRNTFRVDVTGIGQARRAGASREKPARASLRPPARHRPHAGRPSGEATKAAVTSSASGSASGGRGAWRETSPTRRPRSWEQRVGPGQQSEERGIGQPGPGSAPQRRHGKETRTPDRCHPRHSPVPRARPFNGMPRRGRAGPPGRPRSMRRREPVPPVRPRTGPGRRPPLPARPVASSAGTPQSVRACPLPVTTTTGAPWASSAASAASASAASRRRCASTKPGRISSGSALQWASCCSASRAACSSGSSGSVRPNRAASPAKHRRGAGREGLARGVPGHLRTIDRGALRHGRRAARTSRNRASPDAAHSSVSDSAAAFTARSGVTSAASAAVIISNTMAAGQRLRHGVLNGVMGGIVMHFAEDHDLGPAADPRTASAAP
jgi:hypothetical protein